MPAVRTSYVIGTMLLATALGGGLGQWFWTARRQGPTVAVLELAPGTTTPLMGLNISLGEDFAVARLGPVTLRPAMAPLGAALESREPVRPRRFRYAFRVTSEKGATVHRRAGAFSTWFRAVPRWPSVDLGRFTVEEEGRHFLELEMSTVASRDSTGEVTGVPRVPDVRLELTARDSTYSPWLGGMWLVLAVLGVALVLRYRGT